MPALALDFKIFSESLICHKKLLKMVNNLEISQKLIEQLKQFEGKHKFIEDLVRVPGMNFLMPLLHHLVRGAEGLDQDTILAIEQILFNEFIESQTKIKSVIFNHMIVRMKKDADFKARVRVLVLLN